MTTIGKREEMISIRQQYPDILQTYIPERFKQRVEAHLLGNYAQINNYPLILCITGKPGTGKTWQLRRLLEMLQVEIHSVDASLLEDELAGRPAKYLKELYITASKSKGSQKKSAIIIDDFDTTVGEWKQNTGTVNHQAILAFLMHIAENPSTVGEAKGLSRVPLFITANHVERIYQPLIRFGRTDVFNWEPNLDERARIIETILGLHEESHNLSQELARRYNNEPISFFSHLVATARVNSILDAKDGWDTKDVIANNNALETFRNRCNIHMGSVDWNSIIEKMLAERSSEKDRNDKTND